MEGAAALVEATAAGGKGPPGGAAGKENATAVEQQLREHVVRHILSSDVINSVKAHLRARLYADLKGPASGSTHVGSGGATPWRPALPAPPRSPSLHQHILNSLVSEFLLSQRYTYTLSVFLSETGSGTLPRLSRGDLLRLVGVLPESKVHALLTSGGSEEGSSRGSGGSWGEVGAGAAAADCSASTGSVPASLAERMVATLGVLGGRVSARTAACQTFDEGGGWCGGGGGQLSSQQLTARLAAIEEEYQRKSGTLESAAAASLEERLAAYQRECDARCAAQLTERLAALREGELAAVREAEAGKHAATLAAERAALAAAHQERLAQLNKQEEELQDRGRRLHREHDQMREDHLRRMRADEERLQSWKADSEARLAAREATARTQAEAAAAAQRAAEAGREEGERRLAARLADMESARGEAQRAQAAAEGEVGRVAALQRQLAAALEEQGALRQQLSSSQAARQAEQAGLQLELQTLRGDRERLSAAVAAATAAPGLSPSDSARLHQAVRRLMQRVEQLQGEVEAGRERERLWRGSAAEAEKLVGKSAKAQDRALQHAEELRLALAAAAREVGDLQQQAALAAAGVEGPLAAALQAASRDAERWQQGAEARVAAARQVEEGLRREAEQLQQRALANRSAAAAGLQQVLGTLVQGRQRSVAAGVADEDESSSAEQSPAARMPLVPAAAPVERADRRGSYGSQQGTAQQQGQQRQEQPLRLASLAQPSAPQQQQQQLQTSLLPSAPLMPALSNIGLGSGLWQQQSLPQQPPPLQHQVSGSGPASAAQADASKPISRTASDILAAYRARQSQRSASGADLLPVGLPHVASSSSEHSEGEGSGIEEQAAPAPALGAPPAGAAAAAGQGDGYYVSDYTNSEDSGKF